MGIHRLNHAVLYVRDVGSSVAFYRDVLDFSVVSEMAGRAAFLRASTSTNDHDLGLFAVGPDAAASSAGRGSVGLYHLAWEVDTLADLQQVAQRLENANALAGASDHSTTKSLYGRDPDGLEFEIAWVVPLDQLDDATLAGRTTIRPLDLEGELRRYGADRLGGVGVSRVSAPSDSDLSHS